MAASRPPRFAAVATLLRRSELGRGAVSRIFLFSRFPDSSRTERGQSGKQEGGKGSGSPEISCFPAFQIQENQRGDNLEIGKARRDAVFQNFPAFPLFRFKPNGEEPIWKT
jgi:hypothetical protein